jgi:pyridoxamine 5'-phosphate oxidase
MDTRRAFAPQQADKHIEIDDLSPDPFEQFQEWFSLAQESGIPDANAMILATSTRDGYPSARTVLMKGIDERGLVFYTNYESQKGRELAENPRASVVFYWNTLGRQIRVAGEVERVTSEESYEYYRSRHPGSRIGAWASRQSEPLGTRKELLDRVAEIATRFPGDDIPLPPHWGGYLIAPTMFEFWESRENRLHDRFRYTRRDDGTWKIQRLQP